MNIFSRSLYVIATALAALGASALPPEAYAPASVLAQGKWVKISVEQSGMHMIPAATLRQWGFSDPAKVRVYGYGGAMLPDVLDPADYVDDLPAVTAELTDKGLAFYAVGPVQFQMAADGTMSHTVNPYSNFGYYFLTESSDSPLKTPADGGSALTDGSGCSVSAPRLLVHEKELISLGATGRLMVGEDFKSTRTRNFTFSMPGRIEGSQVQIRSSFVANSVTASSELRFSVNGTALPSSPSDRINLTGNRSGYWGVQGITTKKCDPQGQSLSLDITFSNPGMVTSANLDYLEVTYECALDNNPDFFITHPSVMVTPAAGKRVWDVTDPVDARAMNLGPGGAWRNDMAGVRHYAVWSPADKLPAPKLAGSVRNQNLHAMDEVPDMIIVAPDAYMSHARQIADIHHNYPLDTLRVEVASLDQVLNEFGSGAFDPGALRRFFKMLYDRGSAAGSPLRYALMIGKGTCDNRALTAVGRSVRSPMPLWVSEASLQENLSFSSDDYFALLDDFDGQRPQRENLDIAVGRIPATSAEQAQTAVDKIRQYLYSMPADDWQTRVLVLADDENQGQHMTQSEKMLDNLGRGNSGNRLVVNKVYCDAYPRNNSTYPDARNDVFRAFADGTSMFMFIGHGSPTALGSKNIITPNDFRSRFYLRRLPFFYAATCSFLHWDSDITSMAETLMFQPDGGMIGCISALRPVYITNNGNLSATFGQALGEYDADGRVPAVGDIYRNAKNRVSNDTNKMRYVLMSDPALRLAIPAARVILESINGQSVSADSPANLKARQRLEIAGSITASDGSPLDDFNGTVIATLYDAEHSTTSHGYDDGKEITFEQMGEMLFTARATVKNGRFTLGVQMPPVLADNYRPATLSLFAMSGNNDDIRRAAGISRDIYAFGYDETTPADSVPPVIHSIVLNDDNFTPGSKINPDPVLIATISDNIGVNLAGTGIGRQMSVTVDGKETFFDASSSFVPDAEPVNGAFSGTLTYQLNGLEPGDHTIRLRVWDIDNNFADATLTATVVSDLGPGIHEVYTTPGPARSRTQFFVRHNRPDQMMTVKISVYNLAGTPVWSGQSSGRSNGGISVPVTWDLKNFDGTRVVRGIYVYRAEVTTEGSSISTASRKLAVGNE